MGLLDRFKGGGGGGPDALTAEIAARLRAMDAVEAAVAVAADQVDVTWSGRDDVQAIDLTDLRPRWKAASGFDRIEVVDTFLAGLSPDAAPPPAPATVEPAPIAEPEPEPEPVPAAGAPPAQTAGGWDELRTRVLPVLRPAGGGPDCVRWSVGGMVDATVAADGVPVAPGDCERWGVGEVDVRAAATANLREIDPRPEAIAPEARAWVPTAPQGGQSAWLTAPGRLLDAIGIDEGIAFAPLAGELVVVDPADLDLLRSILTSTERIVSEQPEPLTALPFRLTAQGAEPWDPPDDHPLATTLRFLR